MGQALKTKKGLRNNWFSSIKHSIYLVEEERLLKMISRILLGVVRKFLSFKLPFAVQFISKKINSLIETHRETGNDGSRTAEGKQCQDCTHKVWSKIVCWLALTDGWTTFKYLYFLASKKRRNNIPKMSLSTLLTPNDSRNSHLQKTSMNPVNFSF